MAGMQFSLKRLLLAVTFLAGTLAAMVALQRKAHLSGFGAVIASAPIVSTLVIPIALLVSDNWKRTALKMLFAFWIAIITLLFIGIMFALVMDSLLA